jgi:DNA transposition AAA+ family ATPase
MTHMPPMVNTTAPLSNVKLCTEVLDRAMNRPGHLPGMISFYGPSGWGKTSAAAYSAHQHQAYYVECKSSWTKKALLIAMLTEMGVMPAPTIYQMTDQVAEQLVLSGRPLIIDEFDHIVQKNAVEIVRDVYEGSNAPILLIGEERLEGNLRRWERFHNRMLDWIPAQPASLKDAQHLRELYCTRALIEDDLLERIVEISKGAARRICVNLNIVHEYAAGKHMASINQHDWGRRHLCTGEAPRRRVI